MAKNKTLWTASVLVAFSASIAAFAFGDVQTPLRKARQLGANTAPSGARIERKAPSTAAKRAMRVNEALPTLYGIVNQGGNVGYYSFSPETSAVFDLEFTDKNLNPTGSAAYANGKLYVNYLYNDNGINRAKQFVYNGSNGELETSRDILVTSCASAMTYDQTTDNIYGQFWNEDMTDYYWGVLDVADGDTWAIADQDAMLQLYAIAASPGGTIFGIDKFGSLVVVDKNTGKFKQTIGETGIQPQYIQSATFDHDGNLYWATSTASGYNGIYKVDTLTAQVTPVMNFTDGRQIIGLNAGDNVYDDKAPAAPTDMKFNFNGADLFGDVSFTLPTKTVDGTPLTGKLKGQLDMNLKYVPFSGNPGETVTLKVYLSAERYYKFSAYVEQDGKRSPRVSDEHWVGADRPILPENPVLNVKDNVATLTWKAPEKGIHGGYVNPDEMTYTVIRYPEGKYDAEDIKDCSFTEPVDMTKSRRLAYGIVPKYGEKIGQVSYSNDYQVNVIAEPPVSYSLATFQGDYKYFTIEDTNNDGITWEWTNSAEMQDNTSGTNDDWLFSPSIHLKADRLYYVGYSYWIQNGLFYPQTFEIKAGTDAKSTSMTTTVLEPTTIKGQLFGADKDSINTLQAPEEGNYNIGIHNMSTKGGKMRVRSLSVTPGPLLVAPVAPTDFKAVAAEEGELSATVSLTAPKTAINGNPLTAISKVVVERKNASGKFVEVKTFDAPATGAELSFEDNSVKTGNNIYRAVAYNAAGDEGLYTEEQTVYCGEDTPATPTDVKIEVTDVNTAHISWKTPDKGANGHYINPDNVRYNVYLYEDYVYGMDPVEEDVEGNECDVEYEDLDEGEQMDATYVIVPTNDTDDGAPAITPTVIFGDNYTMPFKENFDNGRPVHDMWYRFAASFNEENMGWDVSSSEGYGAVKGCLSYHGAMNHKQEIVSGKISLDGTEDPVLTMRVYGSNRYADTKLLVKVATDFNGEYETVKTIDYNKDFPTDGWIRVQIPLAYYLDEPYIHLAFEAQSSYSDAFIRVDNISIQDLLEHDLAIDEAPVASPEKVKVGDETSYITVKVANYGQKDVAGTDYTVDFYNGDKLIGSAKGKDIKADETATIDFGFKPESEDVGTVAIKAVLNYDADEDETNNVSAPVNVKVTRPSLPVISDLRGTRTDNGVRLNWTAADANVGAMRVTDDFESYDAFAVSDFGDWKTVDVDGNPTFGVGDFEYDMKGGPLAFQVFNPSATYPALTIEDWQPYSGDQVLVAFDSEESASDDWLISPELSGKQQNISFMAKSPDDSYGDETIEIWYSTTGNDVKDFKQLTTKPVDVPASWTEMTYTLPEGTRYFAIRNVSEATYALYIDDVSFDKKLADDVEILGYNIYRNGTRVNDEPVKEAQFDDPDGKIGDKYTVTIVYNIGESEKSNEVVISTTTGISSIDTNTDADASRKWYNINGSRVNNTAKKGIYVTKGKKIVVK